MSDIVNKEPENVSVTTSKLPCEPYTDSTSEPDPTTPIELDTRNDPVTLEFP